MKDILKQAVVALFILGAICFVGRLMLLAIDREMIMECHKLQQQSAEYKDFFITKNEKFACDSFDILIEAPVR